MAEPLRAARLRPADVVRLGGTGLRARPLRVVLAALGVGIGVAAMIAVVGISVSSRAEVHRQIDRLGTNMLRVSAGQTLDGDAAPLPAEAVPMIRRIPPVEAVAAVGSVAASVYRTDRIPTGRTGSIAVLAADRAVTATVGATLVTGRWLDAVTERHQAVVLGATAARRLGVSRPGTRVWLGGQWFGVLGVLAPVVLAPELDGAALVGWPAATAHLGFGGNPSTVYVRALEREILAVRAVLAATAKPAAPGEVRVARPSDALAARAAVDAALTRLLLGLSAVALLVGGIGIANTMVISVLERRGEIGLRRALGATRGQIRGQFLTEALLLAVVGGAGGTVVGTAVTAGYAQTQRWPTVVPVWATLAGLGTTLVVGALAGLYPAVRASRQAPAAALAAP